MKSRGTSFLPAMLTVLACAPAIAGDGASADLFRQMATVFQHPRCANCHTREDFPRQGDDEHQHTYGVRRGADNKGAVALHCAACHQNENQNDIGIPGAADWRLAPLTMAWAGASPAELCRSVRDPARGAMPPAKLVEHLQTSLVRWSFAPGIDPRGKQRTTPGMSFDQFVALARQWVASGAQCPD